MRLWAWSAVIGSDKLQSVGITCALCHSTVDNSLAPGIGRRLDGFPNRDLNVGVIVGLSPQLQIMLVASPPISPSKSSSFNNLQTRPVAGAI